jgi:predicted nucleic acid-binding protein
VTVVIDASVAASWLLASQATSTADALLAQGGESWIAPAIFPLEVRSLLLKLERRRLLTPQRTAEALEILEAIGVRAAPPDTLDDLDDVIALARACALSPYDALYLDLALHTGARLASRDGALLAAARAAGVEIEDLRV